jgi:hypothetical protein
MLKWKHVEKKVYPPRVAATETRTCSVSQNELFLGPVLKNQARAACCWKLETKILTNVWVTTDNLKCAGPCRIHTLATLRVKKRVKVPLT